MGKLRTELQWGIPPGQGKKRRGQSPRVGRGKRRNATSLDFTPWGDGVGKQGGAVEDVANLEIGKKEGQEASMSLISKCKTGRGRGGTWTREAP